MECDACVQNEHRQESMYINVAPHGDYKAALME